MISLTACVTVEVTGVTSDGCLWVDEIALSDTTINALEPLLREGDRDVRLDLEAIDSHNKKWDANCKEK